jgi:hypothetical protein
MWHAWGRKEMCIILSGKPEGDGMMTLVINKQDNTGHTEFGWLKRGTGGGLL